jgi:hypothetical protein
MIRIALSGSTVRNGERVKGTVTWEAEGSKTPRKIEVGCRWRVEGRGRTREEIVSSFESHDSVIPFDFEIPKDGPLTYEGTLLRIVWEIAAEADLPMAFDPQVVAPFTVVARPWDPKEWEDDDEDDDDGDEPVDDKDFNS